MITLHDGSEEQMIEQDYFVGASAVPPRTHNKLYFTRGLLQGFEDRKAGVIIGARGYIFVKDRMIT